MCADRIVAAGAASSLEGMEFGFSFEKLLLIGVIAVIIVGPERLPGLAERFAKFVRRAGEYLRDQKGRMREEFGPEIDEVDWRKLDPRQYDPRRIIRDALFEEPAPRAAAAPASTSASAGTGGESAGTASAASSTPTAPSSPAHGPARAPLVRESFTRETPPPFDLDAT